MTRVNVRKAENRFLAWDKKASALIFAAVLIIVSVTVGCSSEKPKPVSSNNQIPSTQPQPQMQPMPAPVAQAESKPAPKKSVVHKKPATVNYTDKTYGVTFEYPRRYAIETGDAASELIQTNPVPMNFVAPGGVALAAVELPETGFLNTDFSSAFFNVSVHKNLTADQCNEFAVPQPNEATKPETTVPSTDMAKQDSTPKSDAPTVSSTEMKSPSDTPSNSKLILGDMELRATEAVTGEGTRQSDSKYFHVYQNGACYEFTLNVTTDASAEGLVKHVDRDRVFNRLEQILATVKINPVTPEVTAEAPSASAPQTPAQ
ncbi:MAG TPA: hypothetical protein VMG82_02115 [Candidatus Sulfotelmatobacter sp.]|nr:hypothetical protein [Candidatus Sulfotelmatobacter sp.]